MYTILIDTSTEKGVIALADHHTLRLTKDLPLELNQSISLWPHLQDLFEILAVNSLKIDCIAVGKGPGSYTGMRVGVAVAKAFAYAGKIPLIGISSLKVFLPHAEGKFAVLIDAKIAGVYIIKGIRNAQGVHYLSDPEVCAWEKLETYLDGIQMLVTPNKSLSLKLNKHYPQTTWVIQETKVNAPHFLRLAQDKYERHDYSEKGRLDLLYLRQTQAEIEKRNKIDKL